MMQEAQNPQQALDIAAAATRQAHEAAAVPSWGPRLAGMLAALSVVLISAAFGLNVGVVLRSIVVIAAIATAFAFLKLMSWMRGTRRARGVLPRPPAQWTGNVVWCLVMLIGPGLSVSAGMLTGVIFGGWVWYAESGPHTASWKTRLRSAPWKN